MSAIKRSVAVVILLALTLLFVMMTRGERKPAVSSHYSNSTEVAVVVVR